MAREQSAATEMLAERPNIRGAFEQSNLFTLLSGGLKRVEIDDEEFFVAEGDTLLDEDQLLVYANEREALQRARQLAEDVERAGLGRLALSGTVPVTAAPSALIGIVENGRLVRWSPGTVLTYCVLRNTFRTQQEYEFVRDNMRAATAEWEATCGVQFEYRPELDNADTVRPPGVLFPVRGIDAGGSFIAAAFFPNDPANRRRLLVDPSYFTTNFDRVGVLRHEIGHILGFRHEHIRSGAPPACPDEPLFDTIPLTPFDPQSVMHYFCGGAGSIALAITELDRAGSQRVYGPPLSSFLLMTAA